MEPGPGLPSLTPTSAPSLERRRFTRSPPSRGPFSTSAPYASTATPTAEEGGDAPGGREGGPGTPSRPGAETHLQARSATERPYTHTEHAPPGRDDVTRQRYGRRRFSQCRDRDSLGFASPRGSGAGKRRLLSPQRLWQRKLRAQTERFLGPAPSVEGWDEAGQTFPGRAGSAHLAPEPQRPSEAVWQKLI